MIRPRLDWLPVLCVVLSTAAGAEDWPMWRYDAQRSAASPEALPSELHLAWGKQYTARTPVWEDTLNRDLMPYDRVFEPVVAHGLVYLTFNDTGKVVALDAEDGTEQWQFYTDGPVRLPPVVSEGRLFFTSDDGHLYCLDAEQGQLEWKFRGGPDDRFVLGNSRLISMWPARGGPVVADGNVYFAAGIFPFMGTFMYALDATTGQVVWLNDSDGPTFQEQPHGGAWSFGGIGPQGAMVVSGPNLLVPGGRSVPGVLDRATGKVLHYRFHDNNKTGGSFVCADEQFFFNHYREGIVTLYDLKTGDPVAGQVGGAPVVTSEAYYVSGPVIKAFDAVRVKASPAKWAECLLWETPVDASGDLIKAGNCLYAAGGGHVTAIELGPTPKDVPAVAWALPVEGAVERLVAAGGMLFAVTLEGRILAFGAEAAKDDPVPIAASSAADPGIPGSGVEKIVEKTGVRDGYCFVAGAPSDISLLMDLVAATSMHVIVFEADAGRVEEIRRALDKGGLHGKRAAVLHVAPESAPFPHYVASLAIATRPLPQEALVRLCDSVRPYGGALCLLDESETSANEFLAKAGLQGYSDAGDNMLRREGPLAGAGKWTHILGDIGQTGKADDYLVKLPLGLLWFGGNSNEDVLPRHGHGPPAQILGGHLFIQGIDCLSARDVYTGRVLWKTAIESPGSEGVYFNETYSFTPTSTSYNQVHIPGANVRGTNFVVAEDAVYIVDGNGCLVLDPQTGERIGRFEAPPSGPSAGDTDSQDWGYIGVSQDLLIGGADFVAYSDLVEIPTSDKPMWTNFDTSSSRRLFALDRYTGEVRWHLVAEYGFIHNGIAAGDGLLYCLDKCPPFIDDLMSRRGKATPASSRLIAIDLATGEKKWEKTEAIFGSFLCYSDEHGILLQATRPSRDTVKGEDGTRIIAYRGADGAVLWDKPIRYPTFPLLHHDRFIVEGAAYDLKTGDPILSSNPVTGVTEPFTWSRAYGCNHPVAAENLLTFRSGAAGFFDLAGIGGTGNWGGFKSGCTSSLIAADGLLNAPDYTRTCSCSYQNQTSVAMIHMPDAEFWTFNNLTLGTEPIQRLAVNFGAPGDRRADDGALWFEYPAVGGPSPELPVTIAPTEVSWFLHHSLRYQDSGLRWVAASGCEGIAQLTVALNQSPGSAKYSVTLHFAEPGDLAPGQRVFDVNIQGQPRLKAFDIAQEAGGPRRPIVKEFKDIEAGKDLTVSFTPNEGSSRPPLLCGVEIKAE